MVSVTGFGATSAADVITVLHGRKPSPSSAVQGSTQSVCVSNAPLEPTCAEKPPFGAAMVVLKAGLFGAKRGSSVWLFTRLTLVRSGLAVELLREVSESRTADRAFV